MRVLAPLAVAVAGLLVMCSAVSAVPPAALDWAALQQLKEHGGLVFAPVPGAEVTATGKGVRVSLKEGTRVRVGERSAMIGMGGTEAAVQHAGRELTVPNHRVITRDLLTFGPDRQHAVFAALTTCGDYCYGGIWLLSRTGRRTRLTERAGPQPVVAFKPDGTRLAIGSRGLWIGDPRSGEMMHVEDLCAPAWSPRGAMLVRGLPDGGEATASSAWTASAGGSCSRGRGGPPRAARRPMWGIPSRWASSDRARA